MDVELTGEDIARIDRVAPHGAVKGDRYDTHAMASLDSERA